MLSADRAKLFRLLALTNSPYDGEALAASRMANKLLKRTGASWADLFGQDEPNRDTTAAQDPPADTHSTRTAPEDFGGDIFGDKPAWTKAPPKRVVRAGRLRLFLAGIPMPIRLVLGPLTAAGYLAAWTIETDSLFDRSVRVLFSAAGVALAFGLYAMIIAAELGYRPYAPSPPIIASSRAP